MPTRLLSSLFGLLVAIQLSWAGSESEPEKVISLQQFVYSRENVDKASGLEVKETATGELKWYDNAMGRVLIDVCVREASGAQKGGPKGGKNKKKRLGPFVVRVSLDKTKKVPVSLKIVSGNRESDDADVAFQYAFAYKLLVSLGVVALGHEFSDSPNPEAQIPFFVRLTYPDKVETLDHGALPAVNIVGKSVPCEFAVFPDFTPMKGARMLNLVSYSGRGGFVEINSRRVDWHSFHAVHVVDFWGSSAAFGKDAGNDNDKHGFERIMEVLNHREKLSSYRVIEIDVRSE